MIPSKPEKSSRRSSILKPTKLRNPLEMVPVSSAESSPTSKLKRRVSFAEKKHVKEFCDSMEQGTVWDSTYEESEGSQMRSLFSPTDDENCSPPIHQLPNNNLGNYPNDDSQNSSQIFELSTNHPRNIQKRISILEINFLGPQAMEQNPQLLVDKENIPMNPMAELESAVMDDLIPQRSRTNNSQRFEIYCDDEHSPKKSEKERNYSEDATLTLTDSMCLDVDEGGGMVMTQTIGSVLGSKYINKTVLNDEGIEMTEAIASLLPAAEIPARTQIFHLNGMEMTDAIPSILTTQKPSNKTMLNNERMEMPEAIVSLLPPNVAEKTQIFQQNVMEMTEAIPSILNIHKHMDQTILNHQGMEMTEVIPSILNTQKSNEIDENTHFFYRNGMETTEAIPSILMSRRSRMNLEDDGMEMTKAITSVIPPFKSNERTEFFHQGGMELTEAISSLLPSKKPLERNETNENTQIFHQTGMEMTEAVPSILMSRRSRMNFEDDGMEMTKVITSVIPPPESNERTEFFQGGMEMTEAIPSLLPPKPPLESNPTIHNYSMELRDPIASLKRPYRTISSQNSPDRTLASPRAKFSKDYSILPQKITSQDDRVALHRLLHPESQKLDSISSNLQNQSMEFTTVITSHQGIGSEIPRDDSVDLTFSSPRAESPQDHSVLPQKIPLSEDKVGLHRPLHAVSPKPNTLSSNLQNQSMEFTTAITSHLRTGFEIPRDDSMKMIAAILSFSSFSQNQQRVEDNVNASEIEQSSAILSLKNPPEHEMDSSDSLKENRVPEDNTNKRPVSRLLFERQDEGITEPTSTPLEDSGEFIEQLRSRARSRGRDLVDLTVELTAPIAESYANNASFSSSDIQNIEAPSYLFAEESGMNSSTSVNNDGIEGFCEKSLVNNDKYKEIVVRIDEQKKGTGDEMTIDMGTVALPDIESTEDITRLEERRRTHVLCRNNEEEIFKKRRTYTVPKEHDQNSALILQMDDDEQSDNRRRTHVIRKMEEEENEVIQRTITSGTFVITNKTLRKSVEIDGEKRLEGFDNICVTSKSNALSPESNCSQEEGMNYFQEDEENVTLGCRKRVRSENYLANIDNDGANIVFDIREKETKSEKMDLRSALENFDTGHHSEARNVQKNIKNTILNSAIVLENDSILKTIQKSNSKHELLFKKQNLQTDGTLDIDDCQKKSSEMIEDDSELSAFERMKRNIEKAEKLRTCLWEIVRISEEKIFVSFRKTGLVVGVIFHVPEDDNELERIAKIFVIPRLSVKETAALRLTDRLIINKIDEENLKIQFKTYDHVLPLINYVTEGVRVIYDFYEELQRMSLTNVMEICEDKLWFLAKTKTANIILKIFVNIKPIEEIDPEDVDVVCLLGNVRKSDVKDLIKNTKRNHNFLTLYKNDVCDYIELMEESSKKLLK